MGDGDVGFRGKGFRAIASKSKVIDYISLFGFNKVF